MTTVREHIRDTHLQAAEHNIALGKSHKMLAECFGDMGKALGVEDDDNKKMFEKLASHHETLAGEHGDHAQWHVQAAKKLIAHKADGDVDLAKIVPDGISAIIPSDYPVRAVPRFGQPELNHEEIARVAPEYQDLVKISSDE